MNKIKLSTWVSFFFNRCGEEDWLDFNSMVCTLEENSEYDKEDSDNLGVED